MELNKALYLVVQELETAQKKYPEWPRYLATSVNIVTEECGELVKAVNDYEWHGKDKTLNNVKQEAVQCAAMAIRFLMNVGDI